VDREPTIGPGAHDAAADATRHVLVGIGSMVRHIHPASKVSHDQSSFGAIYSEQFDYGRILGCHASVIDMP
jgi:hypothetical protein